MSDTNKDTTFTFTQTQLDALGDEEIDLLEHSDLFCLGLPKWPKMLVTGVSVTVEQAKEIIRRTDSFFTMGCGGNNREYNREVRRVVGMPPDVFDISGSTPQSRIAAYLKEAKWRDRWGVIGLNYVRNSWVSSSFIHGAHGWCHPDGSIGSGDNVGKWPSIEDVFLDWLILAHEFPFLSVDITLYNGESCEDNTQAVVSFQVRDGGVTICEPLDHHDATMHGRTFDLSSMLGPGRSEQGLEDSWVYEWGESFQTVEEETG